MAVVFQLFDGFTDIIECEMAFAFGEARHDVRSPKICKYLQRTDIEISVVEVVV